MADIDSLLDAMSLQELKDLKTKLFTKINERTDTERQQAVEKIKDIAQTLGVSVEELLGLYKSKGKGKAKTKAKAATGYDEPRVTYANPDNPEETYANRGPNPKWFKEKLEQGVTREEMQVAS